MRAIASDTARPWSAAGGVAVAIYRLGKLAQDGLGTDSDVAKAYQCYRVAALAGVVAVRLDEPALRIMTFLESTRDPAAPGRVIEALRGLRRFDAVNLLAAAAVLLRAAGIVLLLEAGQQIVALMTWYTLAGGAADTLDDLLQADRQARSVAAAYLEACA